ncbi:MAG: lysyl oxidase family protein [Solirubrobacteraceae bacterium]|jgi:hypothetical protein
MPRPAARTLAPALGCLLAALAAAGAGAQTGGSPSGGGGSRAAGQSNACRPDRTPRLRCPDLILRMPYDRYFDRVRGRIRYRAGNSIVNQGQGPAELFAQRRTTTGPMTVTQHIYGFDRRRYDFPSPGARVIFKFIPVLGPYWKFENAARFELWSVDARGNLLRLVRTGPKFVYCLRDLRKRLFVAFSPPTFHYPACSQDPRRRSVTLGTSVGWADEYPASYYEQWIDVTGLRGRFVFVQRVDPLNRIRESNEANNVSPRVFLRLPPGTPTSSRSGSRY